MAQIGAQLPIGQVEIGEAVNIYASQTPLDERTGRARTGDVIFVYDLADEWARTDAGWFLLGDLTLEAAVVQYSVEVLRPVEIAPVIDGVPTETIHPEMTIGVLALQDNWALVYTDSLLGWAPLNLLTITEPQPDLLDFLERQAFVKVDGANLYLERDTASAITSVQPLGVEISVLQIVDEWALVRGASAYGWAHIDDLDLAPPVVARGSMNLDSVNFRVAPVDGRAIRQLRFGEVVLILGREDDWLNVRLRDGTAGWVFAEFVDEEES